MNSKLFLAALLATSLASPLASAARVTEESQLRCGVVELQSQTLRGMLGPTSTSVHQLRVGKKLYEIVVSDGQWPADAAQKNQRARGIIGSLKDGQRVCLKGEVSDVDGADPMKDGTGIWIFPESVNSNSPENPQAVGAVDTAEEFSGEQASSAL